MLYTKEDGLPFKLNLPKVLKLALTQHALQRTYQYGLQDQIRPEFNLSTVGAEILEIETDDHSKNPVKIFVRFPFTEKEDLYIAICLRSTENNRFRVKTLWNRSVEEKEISQKTYSSTPRQSEPALAYSTR